MLINLKGKHHFDNSNSSTSINGKHASYYYSCKFSPVIKENITQLLRGISVGLYPDYIGPSRNTIRARNLKCYDEKEVSIVQELKLS